MEENIKIDDNMSNNESNCCQQDPKIENTTSCKSHSCKDRIILAMNILTFIGMIVLFVLYFTQTKSKSTSSKGNLTAGEGQYSIAYVNSDSIMSQYQLFDEYKTQLENTKKRMEEEIGTKAKKFQQEVEDYQKKVQSYAISSDQAQKIENDLMKKQQQLSDLKDNMSNQLMEMEFNNQTAIFDSIISALKVYNEDYNFDYILGYSKGSGILLANEKYDITPAIVEILNENSKK